MQVQHSRASIRGHLVVALALGLLCGTLDALSLLVPLFTTDRVHYTPPRMWVLSPFVWMIYLVLIALVAHAARLARWTIPLMILAGPGALLAVRLLIATRFVFFGVRVLIPLAICAAAMFPLAWWSRRLDHRFAPSRFSSVTTVTLATAVSLLFLGDSFRPANAAGAATTAPAGAPNVVLIFADTMRGDAMDAAPGLSRFAATGQRYDLAFAPYSWTLPSHLAVMTGLGPEELEIDFDRQSYRGERLTLAEAFQRRGYATSAIIANAYLNPGTGMSRGFETYDFSEADLDLCRTSFGFVVKALPNARVPVCRMDAEEITDRALDRFRTARRPLFLTLNYFDAHLPYYVPPSYRDGNYRTFQPLVEYPLVDRALRREVAVPGEVNDHLRRNYLLSVRYLDDELDRLLRGIRSAPGGENTIIAIVGDHGEQFGEHGLTLHANSVYKQVLHVPLIVSGATFRPARIAEPVAITDLYATLLGAAGLPPRRALPRLPGPGENAPPVIGLYRAPRLVTGLPRRLALDAWSVVDDGHHLIRYSDGSEELYDLAADPAEVTNLANDPSASARRERLSAIAAKLVMPTTQKSEGRSRLFSIGYMQ